MRLRTRLRPARGVVAAACLGLVLAACGAEEAPRSGARASDAPARPHRRTKPPSPVGEVALLVRERPAPDRAVLEATWHRALEGPAYLELVLPEGATLVDGRATLPVAEDALSGVATWQVAFPTGRALDAVVRLAVRSAQGDAAVEAPVRLAEDPAPEPAAPAEASGTDR